jgi:hypothetical protein
LYKSLLVGSRSQEALGTCFSSLFLVLLCWVEDAGVSVPELLAAVNLFVAHSCNPDAYQLQMVNSFGPQHCTL